MNPTGIRDRVVATVAVGVLATLALLVAGLVLDAQENGIDSREDMRSEQVHQLAASMDTRIRTTLGSLVTSVGREAWALTPRNSADAARLERFGSGQAGLYLLDRSGTVVNGVLLRDASVIGRTVPTGDFKRVFAGEAVLLPAKEGLTQPGLVLAIAAPVRDGGGNVAGALVFEVPITQDSSFNQEIAQLRTKGSARYLFVDDNDVVVAASDTAVLGERAESRIADAAVGVHRRSGHVVIAERVSSAGWTLVFDQPISDFEGDITGPVRRAVVLVMLGTAIAGAVAVIALLRRLRAAREEQRRLEEIAAAREEFTSIVSHELRTPVAGLIGFLETALDHWDAMAETERRQAVQRAFANARTLRSLTSDVLDSTAIDAQALALHPEPVDLRDLVREAVDLAAGLDPDRAVTVDVPEEPLPVHADPSRIGQVISNLLDNAMRNSPAGSPIEVVATVEEGRAQVTVCDHGSGIAPEDRERVFEKFVRAAGTTARGSGLGLYIARNLIEAHGGTIAAVASPTPGAAIRFSIPLAHGENGAPQRS